MADVLGTFEQAVLLAIFQLRDNAYGKAILSEVQKRLERDVAVGAVYVTLVRLENKGLLTSQLGAGTAIRAGRPRRYYKLQPSGLNALQETRAAIDTLWRDFGRHLKGQT